MAQPINETNFAFMDDGLDFILSSHAIEPSSPSEEIDNLTRCDSTTLNSLYEIDTDDINRTYYRDQSFKEFFNDFQSLESPSSTIDELMALLTEGTEELNSTESNDVADQIQSKDEQLAMIKNPDRTLPVTRSMMEKPLPAKNLNNQSILLSNSVAVTVPTPNRLQLVHPLEDTFRPRYKSDYFPQKGAVRKPRYVADNCGNHFVSLQMPSGYNRNLKTTYIRIALITTSINNRGHFYSPYKFQVDHNDIKVLDQNPIYLPIYNHRSGESTLKFQLVLIKSKLDQLRNAQPLLPFTSTVGNVQSIIPEGKLSPKELINRFQLDKSHIAFTLCTKLTTDAYEIHPETTAISSVITESSSKQSNASQQESEETTANNGRQVSCPNCSHCFDITDVKTVEKENKRKSTSTNSKSASNGPMNKKKKST